MNIFSDHLQLERNVLLTSLNSAAGGSSPERGGCTHENVKVLLDESDTVELLFEVCCSVVQAKVPTEVAKALTKTKLVALTKSDDPSVNWWNSDETVHQSLRLIAYRPSTACRRWQGQTVSDTC